MLDVALTLAVCGILAPFFFLFLLVEVERREVGGYVQLYAPYGTGSDITGVWGG
jgi:hypothetical protein